MSERILELLKKSAGYLSGTELSAGLEISRAAVWKKINILRQKGFIIEAVPSKGYRMVSPPDLSADYIKSGINKQFWSKVLVFDKTTSTNETAMTLATKDDRWSNTVIIADSQERGRGRLGRKWISPPGRNIYMSLLIRPEIGTTDATMLTLLPAVACVHAVKNISNLSVHIKWPNDLILSGKKLGGILTEIRADIDRISFAVIGIGINVKMEKPDFTDGIAETATSLMQASGEDCSRNELIIEMLKQFEKFYKELIRAGKESLLNEWKALSCTIGRDVKVSIGGQTFTGFAEDIDESGMLILKLTSGRRKQVSSGDLSFATDYL